jgi:hypothetical protein
MVDELRKFPNAKPLLELERLAFYAWAETQGLTRLNHTNEAILEELWRDRKGFTKSARQLVGEFPNWRQPDAETKAPPTQMPAMWFPTSQGSWRWLRLLPTVALAMIGVGAFLRAMDSPGTTDPSTRQTAHSSHGERTDLGLSVTSRSNQLEIRWNKASAALTESVRGVLQITDAGTTEALPVDQAQFYDEYVAYTPKTNDVRVRLELTGKDGGKASESVRSVSIP